MNTGLRIHSLYLFIFLSGIAGLGYEMVWSRLFTTALGHEILAVLAVVAGFFSGLALGAYSLDAWVRRSRFPGR
jgi:spermidine synthase